MATEQNTNREVEVTDLTAVLKLLEKPKLAEFYAAFRGQPATIPELLPELNIGKTAAYDYRNLLVAAGLLSERGTKDNSSVYEAREFDLTIHIDDAEITVTPALARVLAERTRNPEVDRFIDQYGLSTLADFIPRARTYAEGDTTHRAIAADLDISRAAAFDMLKEVLKILDQVPESTHMAPDEFDDGEVAARIDEARSSE